MKMRCTSIGTRDLGPQLHANGKDSGHSKAGFSAMPKRLAQRLHCILDGAFDVVHMLLGVVLVPGQH